MSDSEFELARQLIRLLIDVESKMPLVRRKYQQLGRIHGDLRVLGLRLVAREKYGPEAGFMLFYAKGRVLVRIKTRGGQPRGSPHLTVSMVAGTMNEFGQSDYSDDLGKFHLSGGLVNPDPIDKKRKGIRRAKGFDHQVAKSRTQMWADATHFDFPDMDLDDECVERLPLG
jgi:hypothetical protein